jgi:hypothetical protein
MNDKRDRYLSLPWGLAAMVWPAWVVLGSWDWLRDWWLASLVVEVLFIVAAYRYSSLPESAESSPTLRRQLRRSARKEYAELLRHFAAGMITVDEFEEAETEIRNAAADSDDARVLGTAFDFAFGLYDDFETERLRGQWALDPSARRMISRWVMFLQTDLSYTWPVHHWTYTSVWLALLTFGRRGCQPPEITTSELLEAGNAGSWPFPSIESFDEERRTPKLLCGK